MSKQVKRFDVDLDEAHFCGCGNSSRTIRTELKDGDYVLASDYDALLAERDALRQALKALRAATPSLTCESFHHKRRDLHDHDEGCPPFGRWVAAVLVCNAALQGEQP